MCCVCSLQAAVSLVADQGFTDIKIWYNIRCHCQPNPLCSSRAVFVLQAAVSLVADQGFTDINICYSSPRGDDLDTRLLRAMVIKGILEEITTARVNLVNADLLAKNRGLRISEVTVTSNGR